MEDRYILLEVTWGRYIKGMKNFVMFDTELEVILDDSDEEYEILEVTKIPVIGSSPIDDGWC